MGAALQESGFGGSGLTRAGLWRERPYKRVALVGVALQEWFWWERPYKRVVLMGVALQESGFGGSGFIR